MLLAIAFICVGSTSLCSLGMQFNCLMLHNVWRFEEPLLSFFESQSKNYLNLWLTELVVSFLESKVVLRSCLREGNKS